MPHFAPNARPPSRFLLMLLCASLGGCMVNPVPTPEKSTANADMAGKSEDTQGGTGGVTDAGNQFSSEVAGGGADAAPADAADAYASDVFTLPDGATADIPGDVTADVAADATQSGDAL